MAEQQQSPASNLSYLDILDPTGAIQASQIAQRQAIAAALLQRGMQGMPAPNQMAGNVVVRNSPWQGIAGLADTAAGASGLMNTATQAGQLQGTRLQMAAQQYAQPNGNGPTAGNGPFQGMTPVQMLALEIRNPGKLEDMQAEWNRMQNKPTEETLQANQSGGLVSSDRANAEALLKKNANLEFTRDGKVMDKYTGELIAYYPRLAEGYTYAGGQNPNAPIGPANPPSGTTQFPGGPQSFQTAAFANATGTTAGGGGQFTYGGRENVPMWNLSAYGPMPKIPNIQPGVQTPPAIPPAVPQPKARTQQTPQTAPAQFGMSPSDRTIQTATATDIAALPKIQTTLAAGRQQLESALNAVNSLPASGPGSDTASRWVAIASSLTGGSVMADPVKAYQTVKDYLTNASALTAKINGSTNINVASVGSGPDDMNVPALKEALRNALAGSDAGVIGAKYQIDQFGQLNGRDPQASFTAQRNWANEYNPDVFAFNRMSPEDKAQFKANLAKNKAAFDAFGAKYNQAAARGWVQ